MGDPAQGNVARVGATALPDGAAEMALAPGRYRVGAGDGAGWGNAMVEVRPGCVTEVVLDRNR